jgi:sialate O-acetylesterase
MPRIYHALFMKRYHILVLLLCAFNISLCANVIMPKIITDHAVLQRNAPIHVWGWADKGEKVVVTLNKQKQSTVADNAGKWQLKLNPMPAGGPYDLTVKGKNVIVIKDILLGEVWLCSGQSNMALTLKETNKAGEEIAMANYPAIRHFKIKPKTSAEPAEDIEGGQWKVCSPEEAGEFSGVAYYFAKSINKELNVPIGIINASWGSTYIEGWMSHSALIRYPYYEQIPEIKNQQLAKWYSNVVDLLSYYRQKLCIQSFENFKIDDSQWHLPAYDDRKWLTVPFPENFDKTFLPCIDGTVWIRTVVNINQHMVNKGLTLHLGKIKDEYDFFINGEKINSEKNTENIRHYEIDPRKLKAGENVIAIKIINYWDLGGFISPANNYYIEGADGFKIPLADQSWKMNLSSVFKLWLNNQNVQPDILFNGMIHPVSSYTIKGALWYQGESNDEFASDYKNLLPLMISDWRTHFKQGGFPFYFVQLPNYKKFSQNSQNGGATWAEMRESLSKTLSVPNTGMAVTIDLGDSVNIHPKNKEDVGNRLALIALKNLYDKPIVCSGPEVESVTKSTGKMIVTFKKSASALIVKDRFGYLKGFEIAEEDQHFYYTQAILDGNHVILQNDRVPAPVAARYSWSNNPDGNLYNDAGLPASPFRTDSWKLTTEDNKFDSWIGNRYKMEYIKP